MAGWQHLALPSNMFLSVTALHVATVLHKLFEKKNPLVTIATTKVIMEKQAFRFKPLAQLVL